MRFTDYLRYSSKELTHKPVRTGLTLVALCISTLTVVVLVSLSVGTRQVVSSQLGASEADRLITVTSAKLGNASGVFGNVQVANPQVTTLTDTTVKKLSTIDGVVSTSPRSHIWEFNSFTIDGTKNKKQFVAQAEGIGHETDTSMPLSAGSRLGESTAEHQVILGLAYARELGLSASSAIGKTVNITTQNGYRGDGAAIPGPTAGAGENDSFNTAPTNLTATIVGVTAEGSNQNSLFVPEGWAHKVRTASHWEYDANKASKVYFSTTAAFDKLGNLKSDDQIDKDGYSSIIVQTDSAARTPVIAAAIDKLGLGEISTQAILHRISTVTTVIGITLGAVAAVSLTASALGIVNTLLMMVSEQRYIIGVWRACGASRRHIRKLFLLQSALIGVMGGAIGAVGGYELSLFISHRLSAALVQQHLLAVTIPPPSLTVIAAGVALATAFSVLAGLYPAELAARSDTARSLASGQ
jgi:ABC-type antimicrobial peptide transport system permease subunit